MTSEVQGKAYPDYVAELKAKFGEEAGLRAAVGGDFIATGVLEEQLLRSLGLRDDSVVVDVGCGSGRLAYQLRRYPGLRYLGTDVVPELMAYAKKLCGRSDWRFEPASGVGLPAESGSADFVCFFSVITHLPHVHSYRYLQEAYRVLKPGGCVVLSFLEFRLASHWIVFTDTVNTPGQHLNQFVEREAIRAWAKAIGFAVEHLFDGDRPHIPLEQDLVWPDGTVMRGRGNLGQSVAVLRKPDVSQARKLEAPATGDDGATARVTAATPGSPFVALSTRGFVGGDDAVLINGFQLAAAASVVVRVSGRRLVCHGLRNTLARSHVRLHDAQGRVIAENSGWALGSPAEQEAAHAFLAKVGTEPLDETGEEAVILRHLEPGAYTVVVAGDAGTTGLVHIEIVAG
ncbi:class I SAM-dependent methyltransferase [Opitutus sp. ER46]|uniref:class I SAM-dependent methyltransferase n=1 Tax=Opitutus sp. ER46 TaxID=2161864 RepID=UPI0013050151|nr:class I SAM-dependent methyltransferase [Opitutus sp. ER46]